MQQNEAESSRNSSVNDEISKKSVDVVSTIDASKVAENQTQRIIEDSSNKVITAVIESIDTVANESSPTVPCDNNDEKRLSNILSAEEFEMAERQSQTLTTEIVSNNLVDNQVNYN